MLRKMSIKLAFVTLVAASAINGQEVSGNYESYLEKSKIITSNFRSLNVYEDCRDTRGKSVKHGGHFVPPGIDQCKLCVCNNGIATSCRAVICQKPHCENYRMGASCCEYTCDADVDNDGFNSRQVSTLLLLTVSLILLVVCCFFRWRQVKEKIEKFIEKHKVKRSQGRVEPVDAAVDAPTKVTFVQELEKMFEKKKANGKIDTVSSNVTFNEELFLKMSAELAEKNEEIDELKSKIELLEKQLNHIEPNKSDYEELSWRNSYDLQVEINGDVKD